MEIIMAHKATWREPFTPSDDMLAYVAQRPLVGAETWEGVNRYGIHYAAVPAGHERLPDWNMFNKRNDARLIQLIDNAGALNMASDLAAIRNSYTLVDYLREMPGHEGAAEFCRVYGMPWHNADTSADAMIQAATA